jgi:hypothetical protein
MPVLLTGIRSTLEQQLYRVLTGFYSALAVAMVLVRNSPPVD